jgi:hypothetical protein
MKSEYQVWTKLCSNSGFGFDEALQVPTAPDRTWEGYLANNPKARRFRATTLHRYGDLDSIFQGRVTTGEFAQSSIPSPVRREVVAPPVVIEVVAPQLAAAVPAAEVIAPIPRVGGAPAVVVAAAVTNLVAGTRRERVNNQNLQPPKKARKSAASQIAGTLQNIYDKQNAPSAYEKAIKRFLDADEPFHRGLDAMQRIKIRRLLNANDRANEFLLIEDREEALAYIQLLLAEVV